MNSLERLAVAELLDKARAAGVDENLVKQTAFSCGTPTSAGARIYFDLHPRRDPTAVKYVDCYGSATSDAFGCTCWEPVYDTEQADPVPLALGELPPVQGTVCGDCAYRNDSPERADVWMEETLLALPARGEPFYCHDGMRRPIAYRHPRLGDVPADPADWNPPIVKGVPYRADGQPGLLCAGWTARRIAHLADAAKDDRHEPGPAPHDRVAAGQ